MQLNVSMGRLNHDFTWLNIGLLWIRGICALMLLDIVQANEPEIHYLVCTSTSIQRYSCSWKTGQNDNDTKYYVIQNVMLSSPRFIPNNRITVDGTTLQVTFSNRRYGNIGQQMITVNATNLFGSITKSIQYYPLKQAIPLPPSGLQVQSERCDSLHISWRKPRSVHLYEHLLLYKLQYKRSSEDHWTELPDFQKNRQFQLRELDAFTEYNIRVACKFETYQSNLVGWSSWSGRFAARTDTTRPGSPTNLGIHTIALPNVTSVHVTWLSPRERNGPINKYAIRYKLTGSKWSSRLSVATTSFELNVMCSTPYVRQVKFGVAAVNIAADGIREFFGKEEFIASSVCWANNHHQDVADDSDAIAADPSATKSRLTTTMLAILLAFVGLVVLIAFIITIMVKRSKLHGTPKIEWRFMQLAGPSPPQTETELFDELTIRPDGFLQHSPSLTSLYKSVGDTHEIIAINDLSVRDDDRKNSDDEPSQKQFEKDELTDQWLVVDDFSYVTNDF